MNPGAVEEGSKVASSLISNLHDSPITLALVVFNIIFLSVIYFANRDERKQREEFQTMLFKQQEKTFDMLYNCTPNPKREESH